ncbi:MAG: hypothetical protein Q8L52_02395 [bacterium]|nr:hypothetical protein [bacterium]
MYNLTIHKNLDPQKWATFPIDRQIFMIANELQRLLTCIKNGIGFSTQRERIECAFELVDLTISVQNGHFRYELLRWREVFASLYLLDETNLKKSYSLIELLLKTLLQLSPKTNSLALSH